MIRRILAILVSLAVLPLTLVLALSTPAAAHEERASGFPDGTGKVPTYAGLNNKRYRVVCTPSSRRRIKAMPNSSLKRKNQKLLKKCRFNSIQTAVNTIKQRRTSIYVLPGVYDERRWASAKRSSYCSSLKTNSKDPLDTSQYIGSITSPNSAAANAESNPVALSYADQLKCPHNLNLIAVFGDRTPENKSIKCDSKFCGTQIVGTGRRVSDVLIDNKFSKLNAIRGDRAGGLVLRNFTVQQAEFNAVYLLETDGFMMDRLVTRANDEYGILAFASDHGLIKNTDNYYNGDSGIYPGSGSDLNANNPNFKVTRYAIEIRNNRSHHNTLGYSGTAGNSIWAHDNDFYDNATGIATDSLFPGHPGLPQDHARWSSNRIYSNNENWYTKFVDTGICAKPMKERGYMQGTVCPVVPTPVGTGVLIAGGNFNSTDNNFIYDNWRFGTMQFWVPAPLRDEYDPQKLDDTSHHNHTTNNKMGIKPGGAIAHNGMDHWWDDQGTGNCWQGNSYSRGHQTDNFVIPPASCDEGGSIFRPGLAVKDAGFLSCSQYDRNDERWRHPAQCNWFDSPSKPTGADPAPLAAPSAPTKGSSSSGFLLVGPLFGLMAVAGVRRRRAQARRA